MTTSNKKQQQDNNRLIRRKDVQGKTGLGASSIYAMMAKGDFPKPLQLSVRRVAWIESVIDKCIAEHRASHKAAIATMEA